MSGKQRVICGLDSHFCLMAVEGGAGIAGGTGNYRLSLCPSSSIWTWFSPSANAAERSAAAVDITPQNLSILKTARPGRFASSTLEAICAHLECQPGEILEYRPEAGKEIVRERLSLQIPPFLLAKPRSRRLISTLKALLRPAARLASSAKSKSSLPRLFYQFFW